MKSPYEVKVTINPTKNLPVTINNARQTYRFVYIPDRHCHVCFKKTMWHKKTTAAEQVIAPSFVTRFVCINCRERFNLTLDAMGDLNEEIEKELLLAMKLLNQSCIEFSNPINQLEL